MNRSPDPPTLFDLRQSPHLHDLPDEPLQWLIDHVEVLDLEPGEAIIEPDMPADHMFVMLSGSIHVYRAEEGQRVLFLTILPGDISGLLPYSRLKVWRGSGIAVEPTRALRLHKRHFPEMLQVAPDLGQRLVGIMSDRVRETTRSDQQRAKMAALGKLSAGLAHELNNPAAAARRSAGELQDRLGRMPGIFHALLARGVTPEHLDAAHRLVAGAGGEAQGLSSLERSEREDALADWLDEREVAESWVLAETLVDAGIDEEALDELEEAAGADVLPALVCYLEGMLAAGRLLEEVASAAERISDLIGSVKAYSHMDQAPDRQMVDVRDGIESTLRMLGHALKKKQVRLERDYQDDAPQVPVFVSELNQVWTNLIDNAVDAVDEGGRVRISTRAQGRVLTVRVVDDGPGIPEEVRARIFEPFFTTKAVGDGTGLGLDIVQRILRRHEATIDVDSRPGRTEFAVHLPLEA